MNALSGRHILVVDDDALMREVVAEIFTDRGAQVTEAENGVDAFSLVRSQKFDVVFTDVRMPGGDGITLAKEIHNLTGHKPLVFVCSGFSDLLPEVQKELGIIRVFNKPFSEDEIANEIIVRLNELK